MVILQPNIHLLITNLIWKVRADIQQHSNECLFSEEVCVRICYMVGIILLQRIHYSQTRNPSHSQTKDNPRKCHFKCLLFSGCFDMQNTKFRAECKLKENKSVQHCRQQKEHVNGKLSSSRGIRMEAAGMGMDHIVYIAKCY